MNGNGPTKMILIDSVHYRYAEIDLIGSLQLSGPNNVGKTTLINALQFLYIDGARNMQFGGHGKDETQRHYFPGEYSYVLFECQTHHGTMIIGYRGVAEISGGEPRRFYYRGQYERADFWEERRALDPSEVDARLALKDFTRVEKPSDLRDLLSGDAQSGGLGLVAIREAGSYKEFQDTFRNLLALSTISQEQMKHRLMTLTGLDPEKSTIDVRKLFGETYEKLMDEHREIKALGECTDLIRELTSTWQERDNRRAELVIGWRKLGECRTLFEAEHQDFLAKNKEVIDGIDIEIERLGNVVKGAQHDSNEVALKLGPVQEEIRKLDREKIAFDGFLEDLERGKLQSLDVRIKEINGQIAIVAAEDSTEEAVAERILRLTGDALRDERLAADFESLAVTELRKSFSDDELRTAYRIVNPRLLEARLGGETLVIEDRDEMLSTLRSLCTMAVDGVFVGGGVRIDIARAVISSDPLMGITNAEELRNRAATARKEANRLENVLRAIQKKNELKKELEGVTAEFKALEKRIASYEEFQKRLKCEPELNRQQTELSRQIREHENTISGALKSIEESNRERGAAVTRKETGVREYNQAQKDMQFCKPPHYDDIGGKAEIAFEGSFPQLAALYRKTQHQAETLTASITEGFDKIYKRFADRFTGSGERGHIAKLNEVLNALPERTESVDRLFRNQIHSMKKRFKLVLTDLRDLKKTVVSMNGDFRKIKVSNLRSVELEKIGRASCRERV